MTGFRQTVQTDATSPFAPLVRISARLWVAAFAMAFLLAWGIVSLAAEDPPLTPPPPAGAEIEEADIQVFEEAADGEAILDLGDLDINGIDLEMMEVGGEVEFAIEAEVAVEADVVIKVAVDIAGEAPAQKQGADDEWEDEDLEPELNVQQPRFIVNDETFDQWVFNQVGNAQKALERFHTSLNVQVDSIAASCELAPEQREKLLLAGRGDINRFFDGVEVCRKKFDKVKTDQNRINEIFQDIQPLQLAAQAGLFGESSFFHKVVKKTLTEEQRAKVEVIEKERRQFQFKAKVDLIIAALDDTIAMRAEQRKALTAMLLETPAPKRYGQYDSYLLLYKISRLPEEKMKKLFDPPQWRALDRQLEQARNLQPFLRQQGLLSDDDLER